LESFADSAGKPDTDLPKYVLRYCGRRIRHQIEDEPEFAASDWGKVKDLMKNLFGASEKKKVLSAHKFRDWVAEKRKLPTMVDIEEYYREFRSQAVPLVTAQELLAKDMNLLFYTGLPEKIRDRVYKKLPTDKQNIKTPADVDEIIKIVRGFFNEHDINTMVKSSANKNRYDSSSEEDSESSSSE
ncbi:hypothetical protein BDN72DRAFT_741571, partial [Pluteus cervinus]